MRKVGLPAAQCQLHCALPACCRAGRAVTVLGEAGGAGGASSLALCDVRLLGAFELPLATAAALQAGQQVVWPQQLQPDFPLAIDDSVATCLAAPAASQPADGSSASSSSIASGGSSSSASRGSNVSWALALSQGYSVLAVGLAGEGSWVEVELLDASGSSLWSAAASLASNTSSVKSSSSGGGGQGGAGPGEVLLELPAPSLPARQMVVRRWSSLCEVRLLVSSLQPPSWDPLQPPPGARWLARGGGAAAAAAAAIDGNRRTCANLSSDGTVPALALQLDATYRVVSLELVAAQAANVSIGGVAWPARATCAQGLQLQPWQLAAVDCEQALDADALGVWVEPAGNGTEAAAGPIQLVLCEVGLVGRQQAG